MSKSVETSLLQPLKRFLREHPRTRRAYRFLGEGWQRVSITCVRLTSGRYYTAKRFDRQFVKSPDPWGYMNCPLSSRRHHLILEMLPRATYGRMLEIGCAEGWITRSLSSRAAALLAVDISTVALDRARNALRDVPNIEFRNFDLLNESVGGEFDAIICAGVLVYIEPAHQSRIRDRLVRALPVGGHILLENQKDRYPGQLAASHIHALYSQHPALKVLRHRDADNYSITVFEKFSKTC